MTTTTATKPFAHLYANSHETYEASPICLKGEVIHGFKRGSKELGIPTANINMDNLGETGQQLKTGIYYGWCRLHDQLFCTVVSVGWNPFYKNEKKTVEAHLLASLDDFYGEEITVLLFGYLRDEANFTSLDELITCIHRDIELSKEYLETNPNVFKFSQLTEWEAYR